MFHHLLIAIKVRVKLKSYWWWSFSTVLSGQTLAKPALKNLWTSKATKQEQCSDLDVHKGFRMHMTMDDKKEKHVSFFCHQASSTVKEAQRIETTVKFVFLNFYWTLKHLKMPHLEDQLHFFFALAFLLLCDWTYQTAEKQIKTKWQRKELCLFPCMRV